VKRYVLGWSGFAAFAAFALLVARFFLPGYFAAELDIFILAVGGLALFLAVAATRGAYPLQRRSELAAALERDAPSPARPLELERLERELPMATETAFDLHARLRPVVREIAGMRLAAHGLSLEEGQDLLGEEIWEIVRPERRPPSERHAEGIPPAALRRLVERLETL
jgi:hypothetical protein